MIDILIPTCKKREEITEFLDTIMMSTPDINIISSCFQTSASTNRNYCLNMAKSEIVIMIDDDILGFFDDWHTKLIQPLSDPDVVMVSARLMDKDNKPGLMVGENYNMIDRLVEIEQRQLPTACIAFRNNGTRFDENYVGSGFEDNDFCHQLATKYPKGKFIINNDVKITHINEMKNQGNKFWKMNESYYLKKWGIKIEDRCAV